MTLNSEKHFGNWQNFNCTLIERISDSALSVGIRTASDSIRSLP